jgi:hypothetical protein
MSLPLTYATRSEFCGEIFGSIGDQSWFWQVRSSVGKSGVVCGRLEISGEMRRRQEDFQRSMRTSSFQWNFQRSMRTSSFQRNSQRASSLQGNSRRTRTLPSTTHIESRVETHVQRAARLENDFSALLMKLIAADAPRRQSLPLQQQLKFT